MSVHGLGVGLGSRVIAAGRLDTLALYGQRLLGPLGTEREFGYPLSLDRRPVRSALKLTGTHAAHSQALRLARSPARMGLLGSRALCARRLLGLFGSRCAPHLLGNPRSLRFGFTLA